MSTFLRLVAVLWAGTLMTACVAPTEFTSPLADPGTVEIDRRLLGTWYGVSRCDSRGNPDFHPCARIGGQPAMLTALNIGAEPGDREVTVRATVVALDVTNFHEEWQRESTGRVLQLRATVYPASIDGVTYYNIRRHAGVGYDYTGTGESPHFIIAQVELQGEDTLSLRVLHWYSLFDAEGATRRVDWRMTDSYYSYSLVDATREQLIAKLRTTDRDELFPYRIGPFRRLTTRLDATGLETTLCLPDDVRRAARFVALRDAAYTLARLGLARQARQAADEALKMDALGVRDVGWSSDVGLGKLIEALAMAGDHEAARATLERALKKHGLNPPESVICAQARVGPVSDAVRMAEQLLEYDRASALRCIAIIQMERGDRCGALTTARSTGQARVLIRVAEAFRQAGDTAAALELLSDAAALSAQDSLRLLSIARDQAEWGDADAARKTLRHAASAASEQRDITPGRPPAPRIGIAELQAQLGDRDAARAMLEPMLRQIQTADIQRWLADQGDRYPSDSDIPRIIALQVRLGDHAGARQTRDAFVNQQGQHDRYGYVALAHAAMGDLPAALEGAKALGGWVILYEIADLQRSNGDVAGASQTLKLAVGKAQEAAQEDLFWPGSILVLGGEMDKARLHIEAGDQAAGAFYIALATERAMQGSAGVQVRELLTVADGQRDLGDMGGARCTALHAMSIAERMPLMESCDSGLLLDLLGLPELETKANQ